MIPDSILLLALNFVFASFAIAALALLFAYIGRSLPIRHAILFVGLVACLAAPIAITAGWFGNWGRLPSHQMFAANRLPANTSESTSHVELNRELPSLSESESVLASNLGGTESSGETASIQPTGNKNSSLSPLVVQKPDVSQTNFDVPRTVGTGVVLVWTIGILFSLAMYLQRWRRAKRLVRACEPINDPRVQKLAATRASQFGMTRVPELLKSSSLAFPAVTGFRVPRLIVPENLLQVESESQLQLILAHELAHISRKDHRTIVLQAAASCLYWWNPLVYCVSSQLSNFRELICDDIVVDCCGRWEEYARSIVAIAEGAIRLPHKTLQLGMSAGDLEQRVIRLLAKKGEGASTRLSRGWNSALIVVATIGVSSLAVAQVPVHSIAYENRLSETRLINSNTVEDNDKLTTIDFEVMQELTGVKETPSVVFHYRPTDLDDKELANVVQINLKKFEECERLLKMDYRGRVHIFLYRDVADLQKTTGTPAVAFSTGTISVHQAIDFESVHELTHIFALQFPSGDDAVTDDFVVEGLATILAETDEDVPIHSWAAVYQSTSRLPDLIEFRRSWPDGLLPGVHPYHVAGSFVGYLIEEFGIEKVKRWYVQSTEAHMEFGKPLRRLERDWRKWLERRTIQPNHREHIQAKLGMIPEKYALAKEIKLFDGKSIVGLQADDESKWNAKNGRLVGSINNDWTYIYSKRKFQPNVGLRVKFRLVEGNAVSIQLNRKVNNGNHVNLATWATYMSLTNGAYVVIENLKVETGQWNEVVVVNENGTGRLYLNGIVVNEHEGAFHLNEGSLGVGVEAGIIEVEEFVALELPSAK